MVSTHNIINHKNITRIRLYLIDIKERLVIYMF